MGSICTLLRTYGACKSEALKGVMYRTMTSMKKIICLLLLCVLSFQPLCSGSRAEKADDIREILYQYCESELGYTRDNLTPYNLVQNEDGSWDFSFYVKDAEPMTNGLVIGSLDSNGKLVEIKGPAPVSTVEWLNEQVGKCMFSYQDIYELKQQWEPKLDSIPEKDMEFFDSIQSFNPILDFLRLDIVLPDEQCIPYEEAKQKSIDVIEAMDGWKPEMTEHIDVMVELIYIPDGMDHPVWQFIYALASDVFYSKAVLSEEEYTNEMSAKNKQMMEEEKAVFGGSQNLPIHISIRIDAYTGEQVGETFLETPPVCGIGYTGIVLWK